MIEKVPAGAFAIDLTKEELMKRETPDDYFGWNINRPTQKLALHVYFPEDTKPQVYGILVRYASASGFPADRPQYEEQRNLDRPIMTGPEGDRFVLKLKVEYPMIGLIYILYWRPVEKHRKVGISENLYQPQAKATGISPGTYGRLRTALLECGPFATDNELQAVFIDSRIQPWRHSLPKSDSTANRVQAVINFLYNKYSSSQENALVLFLRVLSEQIDAGDECRQRLIDLAQEIELERL
jgi:hypothetical protein